MKKSENSTVGNSTAAFSGGFRPLSNVFVLCVALLGGPSAAQPLPLQPGGPGEQVLEVPAPGLASPGVGQRGRVTVAVHGVGAWGPEALPVLYLPGFDAGTEDVRATVLPALTAAVEAGRLRPLLVAVVDGRKGLGGGFYAGSWGDWLATAVPGLFRSLGVKGKPVLVGHSMGALGALRLAVAEPDVFAGVVAVSPVTGLESVASARVVRRAAGLLAGGEGPSQWARTPTLAHFRERLFWAAVAAFMPQQRSWASALKGTSLTASTRRALVAQLEPQHAFGAVPRGFCDLPVKLYAGSRDVLVAEASVKRLGEALATACPGGDATRVRHDGDHLSRLPEDVVEGLAGLAAHAGR